MVEIYYRIGLIEEAKAAASLLGYNYNSSEWYEKSYTVLNKNYKPIRKRDDKEDKNLVNRIKKIFLLDDWKKKYKKIIFRKNPKTNQI